MTTPQRIIQLSEHLGRIGDIDVSLNRRTKKIDLVLPGHKASHWDSLVVDHITQAILDLIAGVAPANIARSGGHITRVWAEDGALCIQTQGPHPGTLYKVVGTQVFELLGALHRGRMLLDGRAG